jgi:hypothetical protein
VNGIENASINERENGSGSGSGRAILNGTGKAAANERENGSDTANGNGKFGIGLPMDFKRFNSCRLNHTGTSNSNYHEGLLNFNDEWISLPNWSRQYKGKGGCCKSKHSESHVRAHVRKRV